MDTIREITTGKDVAVRQIAPGEFVEAAPVKVRVHGIIRMVPEAGGTGRFLPAVKQLAPSVPLTNDLLVNLGIPIKCACIYLRRLAHAGLIKLRHINPHHTHVDLASLADFLEASEDPEFWTEERRRAYRLACLSIKG